MGSIAHITVHQQLTHPFGCAHDVGQPHSLVRGDQHKMSDPVSQCLFQHHMGAPDIVGYGLPGVALQHRDMFVCSRMEDHLGLVVPHHPVNEFLLPF